MVRFLKPAVVVELGTNVGISGCYIASALEHNNYGKLVTLEGVAPKAAVAADALAAAGLKHRVELIHGDFFNTLPGVLAQYGASIEMGFIDGFHEKAATVRFHNDFVECIGSGTLIYDDIRWSKGMLDAWRQIQQAPGVGISVDAHSYGVNVLDPGARSARRFYLPSTG